MISRTPASVPPQASTPRRAFFCTNSPDALHPRAIGRGIGERLEADVFVEPDGPTGAVMLVDLELVAQQMIAHGVGGGVAGVDGAELADPDVQPVLQHVLAALQELLFERLAVVVLAARHAGIGAAFHETGFGVVMVGVDDAGPGVAEHVEVLGVTVAFQEDQVVRVYGADGVYEAAVDRHDEGFARIVRFVDGVVPGDPGVVAIARGEGFPQVDGAILEMLVPPEERLVGRVVGVPVLVLVAGEGVQVNDGVDFVSGAQVNDAVEVREAALFDDEGVHIVFEVAIVDRDAYQVEAQRLDVLCVRLGEEVFEEAVEEELILRGAEDVAEGFALGFLVGGVAGDEVFHVHPAAEAEAAEDDRGAGGVGDVPAAGLAGRKCGHGGVSLCRAHKAQTTCCSLEPDQR